MSVRGHAIYLAVTGALLAAGVWGAQYAWKWYTVTAPELRRRLEASTQAEAKQTTAAAQWETRARAAEANVGRDTVKVREFIRAPVSYSPPNIDVTTVKPELRPNDGYAVPMARDSAVALLDSLGRYCTRLEHDCTTALAAKDSAIAHRDSAYGAQAAALAVVTRQRNAAERSSLIKQLVWGAVGAAAGRLSCRP